MINKSNTKQLLAFYAMAVGMFMAILDIQIVATSLQSIASGISASYEELSWIQTSYLIAEVIAIPMTGFCNKLLSTRICYTIASCGFTIMSIACAFAWNLQSMIIFRALQGLIGGMMIPTVFGTVFTFFAPAQRIKINIILGLILNIAPTIGPTLGGYITEYLSWRGLFLINLIPGIGISIVVFLYGNFNNSNHTLLKNFDSIGIFLMALALGLIEYVLEEGSKSNWFENIQILSFTVISVICFVLFILRSLTFINPVVDLTIMQNKNFSLGCIFAFIMGICAYSTTYITPLFLSTVANLNSLQIGLIMSVNGISQFIAAPIVGKIMTSKINLKIITCCGLCIYSLGCYLNSFLTPDAKFWEFFLQQLLRGIGLMTYYIPIANSTLGSVPKNEAQNASGLFTLMRSLGGAVGIATTSTLITHYSNKAYIYLNENIIYTKIMKFNFMNNKSINLLLHKILNMNAFTIAINNTFFALSLLILCSTILLLFMPIISHSKNASDH